MLLADYSWIQTFIQGDRVRRSVFLILGIGPFILLFIASCRDLPSDRLYALKLQNPPSVDDWKEALPRIVTVRGGRKHEPDVAVDIDQDTVHTTTASCHHGASLPDPVPVDMRAFYTDSDLFVRLSWPDASRDDSMRQWEFDGAVWSNTGEMEDGFGIAWYPVQGDSDFTCSRACHIDDFGVRGSNFHATNKMKLAADGDWLDLWNWKAGRTGKSGFADDRYIDLQGMHGDVAGEIFNENSVLMSQKREQGKPFSVNDTPVCDGEGIPISEKYREPGETAPGYLTERPVAGRADVIASALYEDGRWTVTLRRALNTNDSKDVRFSPGGSGISFGLSLMDNTLFEHYASTTRERLVLLVP